MEKIKNLFNQRLDETEGPNHAKLIGIDDMNRVFRMNNGCEFCFEFVFSKRFQFIEWLIKKDKLKLQEYLNVYHPKRTYGIELCTEYIVMTLAIENDPIKFLNSVLK